MDSVDYYNKYASIYFENTVNLDMSEYLEIFMKHIPEGGTVLDLGCGSGRDSLYLLDRDYNVTSLDASKEMCALAEIHTDREVLNMKFEDLDFNQVFDGVWACGSLLHAEPEDMKDILSKISMALKENGVLYMSVKEGDFRGFKNERYFAYYQVSEIKELFHEQTSLEIMDIWKSKDVRTERNDTVWLHVLAKKIDME